MSFTRFTGIEQVISFFQKALRNKRIAHAYCFYGSHDTAKELFAKELVKAIHCEEKRDDACGSCRSCRQIEHGNHLDVVTLQPEGSLIKIDQLRQLQQSFRYKSSSSKPKVVMIHHAEKMRAEAANSLLKFLEEPATPMVAILLTDQVQSLLPTIRSRCQQIRFPSLSPHIRSQQWQQYGLSTELAKLFAHLHLTLPSEEKSIDPNEWQRRITQIIKWNEAILKSQSQALLQLESEWFKQELEQNHLPLLLDILLLWDRELLLFMESGQTFLFPSWFEDIKKQAFTNEPKPLIQGFQQIMNARMQLENTFLQPKNIMERLVLELSTPTSESVPDTFQAID
ncbi:DNA polymerase-3 subunit delta' [Seinonella peptonophila]|uniref:DNA polymerase-3 subunit delta n=1 Tax=Seinonella peptonophila TaxID=112248 RepID=A0A1M4X5T2_9BACL|nr:DNA polymerase III subunit delta' [Seinonella peptonophila]SHE88786.1 DNA polymerase-3 subunit delta' [Seinonella peptonophila]